MIGSDYFHKKDATIGLFNRYCQIRGSFNDGVDENELKTKIEQLECDNFKLYIVGKAKAGKSTLINAILGRQVLPTDTRQCSSAIIEICYSKDCFVEICYENNFKKRKNFNLQNGDMLDEAVLK